jgi:hypothetical protein
VPANFINALRSRKREDLTRTVHFDAASYSCTGDAEPNKVFKRDYRAPFVVPKLA